MRISDWRSDVCSSDLAVGGCPVVCSVATEGLSGRYIQEKGLLAARLAMTAISLTWHQPSEGLRWMNLLYDRRRSHRHTVSFGSGSNVGSNSEDRKSTRLNSSH